ncbi:hypothetical protein C8R45DRAFT_1221597 [Mycena sanguinolenta]|nr:hypothetical protein C8R45DRAFT_1221597 [Mycena sanguinolenta]
MSPAQLELAGEMSGWYHQSRSPCARAPVRRLRPDSMFNIWTSPLHPPSSPLSQNSTENRYLQPPSPPPRRALHAPSSTWCAGRSSHVDGQLQSAIDCTAPRLGSQVGGRIRRATSTHTRSVFNQGLFYSMPETHWCVLGLARCSHEDRSMLSRPELYLHGSRTPPGTTKDTTQNSDDNGNNATTNDNNCGRGRPPPLLVELVVEAGVAAHPLTSCLRRGPSPLPLLSSPPSISSIGAGMRLKQERRRCEGEGVGEEAQNVDGDAASTTAHAHTNNHYLESGVRDGMDNCAYLHCPHRNAVGSSLRFSAYRQYPTPQQHRPTHTGGAAKPEAGQHLPPNTCFLPERKAWRIALTSSTAIKILLIVYVAVGAAMPLPSSFVESTGDLFSIQFVTKNTFVFLSPTSTVIGGHIHAATSVRTSVCTQSDHPRNPKPDDNDGNSVEKEDDRSPRYVGAFPVPLLPSCFSCHFLWSSSSPTRASACPTPAVVYGVGGVICAKVNSEAAGMTINDQRRERRRHCPTIWEAGYARLVTMNFFVHTSTPITPPPTITAKTLRKRTTRARGSSALHARGPVAFLRPPLVELKVVGASVAVRPANELLDGAWLWAAAATSLLTHSDACPFLHVLHISPPRCSTFHFPSHAHQRQQASPLDSTSLSLSSVTFRTKNSPAA